MGPGHTLCDIRALMRSLGCCVVRCIVPHSRQCCIFLYFLNQHVAKHVALLGFRLIIIIIVLE